MHRVMLVEDDDTMLSLLSTLLQLEGFEVVPLDQQDHWDDVVATLRRENPAVILLDVHLRQFNGLDLLRFIRQDEELQFTRVIMLSGMDVGSQCLAAGANDFILKPYMPDELIQSIKHTVRT